MSTAFEQTTEGRALDALLAKLVHESLTAEERQQLQSLLAKSSQAQAHYLRHLDLHCQLTAHWGNIDLLNGVADNKSPTVHKTHQQPLRWTMPYQWAAAATLALVVLGAVVWYSGLLTSSNTIEVLVNNSDEPYMPGQILKQGHITTTTGDMTFKLASGVVVDTSGPTHFNVINAMQLDLLDGAVTADASLQGTGFTVKTKQATITDLSTRFGVKTGAFNYTDVVVFEGAVAVSNVPSEQSVSAITTQLNQLQAARINESGVPERLSLIELNEKGISLSDTTTADNKLIDAITDNLGSAHNFSYYGLIRNRLRTDSPIFLERTRLHWHAMPGLPFPPELVGADVIMSPYITGDSTSLQIKLHLARPCSVYVLPDLRAEIPAWLKKDFVDTGIRIRSGIYKDNVKLYNRLNVTRDVKPDQRGNYYLTHAVWRKKSQAGVVELGPPHVAGSNIMHTMYGIAIKALPSQLPSSSP